MKTATATATATALTIVTNTTSKRPPQLLGLILVVLINTSSFADDEIKLSDLRPNYSKSQQNILLPPPPPPPPTSTLNVVPIPAITNKQPDQVFIHYKNPASDVSANAHIWNHSSSGQSGGSVNITVPLPGQDPR